MRKFRKHIALAALLAAMTALGLMMPHPAKGDKPSTDVSIVSPLPLPVQAQQNGAWNVGILGTPTFKLDAPGTALPVTQMLPANAFSIPPVQLTLAPGGDATSKPDPSGTRYAITSVVVSNPTGAVGEVTITAWAFSFNAANCGAIVNAVASAPGPKLTVQANSTATLMFPQPYVTAAVSGPNVCLAANGSNLVGESWSAVGYKILP